MVGGEGTWKKKSCPTNFEQTVEHVLQKVSKPWNTAEKIETRLVRAMIDLVLQKLLKPWNMGIKTVTRQPFPRSKIGSISSMFNRLQTLQSSGWDSGTSGRPV